MLTLILHLLTHFYEAKRVFHHLCLIFAGLLIAKRWMFKNSVPDRVGGGTVRFVSIYLNSFYLFQKIFALTKGCSTQFIWLSLFLVKVKVNQAMSRHIEDMR